MNTRNISAFALIIGAAVVIGGMGLASAHGMGGLRRGGPFFEQKIGMMGDVLGISAGELRGARDNGRSFPDLLKEKGITVEQFHEAMIPAQKEHLQELVQEGAITQEQADARIQHMEVMHQKIQNGEKPQEPLGLRHHGHRWLQP